MALGSPQPAVSRYAQKVLLHVFEDDGDKAASSHPTNAAHMQEAMVGSYRLSQRLRPSHTFMHWTYHLPWKYLD
jgi:hypothetical protein